MTDDLPPQYSAPPAQPMTPSDERLWMTLVDIGGIFFGFVPSLVAYLVLKERSPFVVRNAAAALNFQISMAIGWVVGGVLLPAFGIGALLWLAVSVVNVVFSIIAAVAANRGEDYRYPLQVPAIR